jgi:tetratricopeptide (TPR) repeat protein
MSHEHRYRRDGLKQGLVSHSHLWCVLAAVMMLAATAGMPPAWAQTVPPPEALPPARPGLLAIPLPVLDSLELSVAAQLRDVHRAASEQMAKSRVADAELAETYGLIGQLHHAYEFLEAAEAAYRNAMRLAPDDSRWPHLLGYLYHQSGRLEDAVETYLRARAAQPADQVVESYLGEVYLRLNRRTEARGQFEKMLAAFPAVAHNGLGEVALVEGRYEDAVRHFLDALQRAPHATRIHYALGMAYRGLGQLDLAQDHLRQTGGGTVRAADALVDALPALLRGERALLIQGRIEYQAGAFDAAAEAFRKAVAAAPGSVGARVNLGVALAQTGDLDGGVAQLRAALDLDPDDLTALVGLGSVLAHMAAHDEAVGYFQRAARRAPRNLDVRRQLTGSLLTLGRADEAIATLSEIVSLDAGDEESVLRLTILLANRERYREARELLERTHTLFPAWIPTATTLARMLAASPDLLLRDGARALDLALDVHRRDPAPVHAETVALALAELGRCEEAEDWMRRAIAQAQRDADAEELERLRAEAPRYEREPCR